MKRNLPGNQLTCTQLRHEIQHGHPVRLTIYTGKVSKLGYRISIDHAFRNVEDAKSFAAEQKAHSFNLYGWDGTNWSSDALPPQHAALNAA
jgi:hypothetical protein